MISAIPKGTRNGDKMKERIASWIIILFNISLAVFLLLGGAIVMIQLVGVFTLNGGLAVGVNDVLKLWSIRASVVAAFCGFIVPYLKS